MSIACVTGAGLCEGCMSCVTSSETRDTPSIIEGLMSIENMGEELCGYCESSIDCDDRDEYHEACHYAYDNYVEAMREGEED